MATCYSRNGPESTRADPLTKEPENVGATSRVSPHNVLALPGFYLQLTSSTSLLSLPVGLNVTEGSIRC